MVVVRSEEFYIEYIFDFQNYALQFLAVFRNLVHNLQRTYQEFAFCQSTFAQETKVTLIYFHYHPKIKFPVIFLKHLSDRSGLLVEAKTSGQSLSIINPISHPSLDPGSTKQCSPFVCSPFGIAMLRIIFGLQNLWGLIYLWDVLLCWLKAFREEKVLSQRPHGISIPSRWLASMWFLIQVASPSLPHTLQMRDTSCLGVPSNCLPDGIIFWPFSIIDLTFSSSAWRSALIFHSQLLLLLISCLAHLLRVLD